MRLLRYAGVLLGVSAASPKVSALLIWMQSSIGNYPEPAIAFALLIRFGAMERITARNIFRKKISSEYMSEKTVDLPTTLDIKSVADNF